MPTHRTPTIHTPWSIRNTYAREQARTRGDRPQPTHRATEETR